MVEFLDEDETARERGALLLLLVALLALAGIGLHLGLGDWFGAVAHQLLVAR